jgi:UrcA family protein
VKVRTTLIAAAGAFALLAVPAFAQYAKPAYDPIDAERAYTYDDEIIVIAPGVQRETTGRSASGARIETLTTSLYVDTSDLNLRYDSDVGELHRRIRDTAREACNDLDRASRGVMLDSDARCIRNATREAMVEADAMVYYARG